MWEWPKLQRLFPPTDDSKFKQNLRIPLSETNDTRQFS
jgi:hypothetical protein